VAEGIAPGESPGLGTWTESEGGGKVASEQTERSCDESSFAPATAVSLPARIVEWSRQHPRWLIGIVSLIAVLFSAYPIVFCGKSYVSPAWVNSLVNDRWPSMPGMASTETLVQNHDSDVWAMMWWDVPMGFVVSQSLWEHGELPLWNRYGYAGTPLLGQAVSMIGDPLQTIVILGRGSALAWDLKFLCAKFLFCFGFGLIIFRLLHHLGLAVLYAALGAYCGAYFYITNHPAFFVFSYTPLMLLSGIEWLDLKSQRRVRWGLAWLMANVGCFSGGHVEVAAVLVGGVNLTALAYGLACQSDLAGRVKVLCRMGGATLLFLGLTAPISISFLAALDGAYSLHNEVRIIQIPLKSLFGAFDDTFYRGVLGKSVPGASLLVMAGCILSVVGWRRARQEPFFWVNASVLWLWGGCVFGWIPASVLENVPLLNRVGHTATDFSYLLVLHLTLQSAFGFRALAQGNNLRLGLTGCLWVLVAIVGMLLLYSSSRAYEAVSWTYFLYSGAGAVLAPLLFAYLQHSRPKISLLGWAGILLVGFASCYRFGLYHVGNSDFLLIPGPRMPLNPTLHSIEMIRADRSAPFRVTAVHPQGEGVFSGDYAAVYQLEDIRSCAPLSNAEYIELMRGFPGIRHDGFWALEVTNAPLAQPLLNLLNVKYLLTHPDDRPPPAPGFQIHEGSEFVAVENQQVWPRAFFINRIDLAHSTEDFIQHLTAHGQTPFACLGDDALVQEPELRPLLNATNATVVAALSYELRPNSTSFTIRAPGAGVVCLTEGQAKDFTACANNESRLVFTVNRAFKGIYLDRPGDYRVTFTYRPRYWRVSCTLFWLSLAGVLVLCTARARAALAVRNANSRHPQTL
jgi:hypothetical protein